MKHRFWVFGVTFAISQVGCGGPQPPERHSQSQERPHPTHQSASPSLREILGPLGARQTPEKLAEVAAFIRRWERSPFEPMPENTSDLSTQALMLAWLTESPDVSVVVSVALSRLCEGRGANVGPFATVGSMFGMAAYLIEHPGTAGHEPDVQAAGVASALLWYEDSLRRGEGRNELMDELIAIRDQRGHDGLREWWEAHIRLTE